MPPATGTKRSRIARRRAERYRRVSSVITGLCHSFVPLGNKRLASGGAISMEKMMAPTTTSPPMRKLPKAATTDVDAFSVALPQNCVPALPAGTRSLLLFYLLPTGPYANGSTTPAGKVFLVDAADREYFEEQIRPLIKGPYIDYIGEINDAQKSDFLSGAVVLLVPIDWPEPFGLVMIEAMACGTPVIAFNRGSVPEVIEDGLTGFIVEDINGAIGAVDRLGHLSREKIRQRFEERFTARRMAMDYVRLYQDLLSEPHARHMSYPGSSAASTNVIGA